MLVDDEVHVLFALRRMLHPVVRASVFADAREALAQLALDVSEQREPAVIVSDMRMPHMDGAQMLARAAEISPDSTRILLTGQADVEAAIRAVNDASVFRFLTKPCPPDLLLTALQTGLQQHRLVTAERVLLERTLKGAVAALSDTLALAAPDLFIRTVRIRRLAQRIALQAGHTLRWEEEIALSLAQLGVVSLPQRVLDKVARAGALEEDEQAMLDGVPALSVRILAGIPRLDGVQAAILASALRYDGRGAAAGVPVGAALPLAARLLRLASDLDRLTASGVPDAEAVGTLESDAEAYDPELLQAASALGGAGRRRLASCTLDDLRRGMTVAVDVTSTSGALLIGRGSQVTAGLVARLRNHEDNGSFRGRVVVDLE